MFAGTVLCFTVTVTKAEAEDSKISEASIATTGCS